MPRQYTPRVPVSCAVCGKSLTRTPSQFAKYMASYCSMACYRTARIGSINERFWAKVDKSGDCWIWLANKNSRGYGSIRYGGKYLRAHRVSYEMAYGPIPDNLIVCHHCDNPSCVRPNHLFLGTHADNAHDRDAKGRANFTEPRNRARGERNGTAKLTESDVRTIRSSATKSLKLLAAQYGVTPGVIWKIRTGKSWKHVD